MELTPSQYKQLKKMGLTSKCINQEGDYAYNPPIDNFAEACFNGNNFDEIVNFATDRVDKTDCETWGVNVDEWRASQELALQQAMYWYEDENA